jgi:hypothetical protein
MPCNVPRYHLVQQHTDSSLLHTDTAHPAMVLLHHASDRNRVSRSAHLVRLFHQMCRLLFIWGVQKLGLHLILRIGEYPCQYDYHDQKRPTLLHSLLSMRSLEGFVCAAGGTTTGRLRVVYLSFHDCPPQPHILQSTSNSLLWRVMLRGEFRRSNRTSATDTRGAELDSYQKFTEGDDVLRSGASNGLPPITVERSVP